MNWSDNVQKNSNSLAWGRPPVILDKTRRQSRLIWECTFSSKNDQQKFRSLSYISDTVTVNYKWSIHQQLLHSIQHIQKLSHKEPIQLLVLVNYHINLKLNIYLQSSKRSFDRFIQWNLLPLWDWHKFLTPIYFKLDSGTI